MEKTLKSQNAPAITAFVLANAYLIFSLTGEYSGVSNLFSFVKDGWEGKGVVAVLVALASTVINAVLDSNAKASLVFWRNTNPLPASQAYDKHGKNDARVDMEIITAKYGPLPIDPVNQNRHWYKIYKEYQSLPSVAAAHKAWLLFRDLTSIEFIFILGSLPAHLLAKSDLPIVLAYSTTTLAVYIICMGAARTNGISLVTTVLAEASTGVRKEK